MCVRLRIHYYKKVTRYKQNHQLSRLGGHRSRSPPQGLQKEEYIDQKNIILLCVTLCGRFWFVSWLLVYFFTFLQKWFSQQKSVAERGDEYDFEDGFVDDSEWQEMAPPPAELVCDKLIQNWQLVQFDEPINFHFQRWFFFANKFSQGIFRILCVCPPDLWSFPFEKYQIFLRSIWWKAVPSSMTFTCFSCLILNFQSSRNFLQMVEWHEHRSKFS